MYIIADLTRKITLQVAMCKIPAEPGDDETAMFEDLTVAKVTARWLNSCPGFGTESPWEVYELVKTPEGEMT